MTGKRPAARHPKPIAFLIESRAEKFDEIVPRGRVRLDILTKHGIDCSWQELNYESTCLEIQSRASIQTNRPF